MMINFAEPFLNDTDDCVKVVSLANDDIVTERALRKACEQNVCGKYGTNWMCPPGIGEIDPLIEKVRSYGDGLLIQSVYELEDSFDFEGMMKSAEWHRNSFLSLLKAIEQHIDGKSLLPLNAGHCDICQECTFKQNKTCRFPDKAISSVEAHGIDVSRTLSKVGLKYNNGPDTVSYVGIILAKK